MINVEKQSAASNGRAAVLMGEFGGEPVLLRYVPSSLGDTARRKEFMDLCDLALGRLGWKRDKRCKVGARRIVEARP